MNTRSRRCSTCDIYWPNIDDCRTCPDCDAATWQCSDPADRTIGQARTAIQARPYSSQARPYSSQAAQAPTAELPTISPAYAHRVERYGALGFTDAEAALLASAVDDQGFPVYHGRVSTLIAAGMTREQAVQVFA